MNDCLPRAGAITPGTAGPKRVYQLQYKVCATFLHHAQSQKSDPLQSAADRKTDTAVPTNAET